MTSTRGFPCKPESVAAARHFVREALRERDRDLIDAAELMVSELASNALQHAHSDFEITVDTKGHRVRVGVRDTGHGEPRLRSPEPRAHSGRGLRVVDALAADWGVTRRTQGKLVWFVLQAPDQAQIPAADTATQPQPTRGEDATSRDAAVGPSATAKARPQLRFCALPDRRSPNRRGSSPSCVPSGAIESTAPVVRANRCVVTARQANGGTADQQFARCPPIGAFGIRAGGVVDDFDRHRVFRAASRERVRQRRVDFRALGHVVIENRHAASFATAWAGRGIQCVTLGRTRHRKGR